MISSCKEKKKSPDEKRIFQLTQEDDEDKLLEETSSCPITTLKITIKGLIKNELIETNRNRPLVYDDMNCQKPFSLKLGKNIEIPLEDALFEASEINLEEKTAEFDKVDGTTQDIEYVALKKGGLCIKNYETQSTCKPPKEGTNCLYYESYEEEIYEIFKLTVEVNEVKIYDSSLELIFNKDYELKWTDSDLLSAFWTKLQNNTECL